MEGPVLQPFVFDAASPYAAGEHRGVDIGADAGHTVLAPAAGTVTFAGSVPSSGKSLTITTSAGYAVTLTHLGSIVAKQGAAIAEGDTVGTVGPTGDPEVSQPYVHLGLRVAADDQGYLDPLSLLPAAAQPAVPSAGSSPPSPAAPAPAASAPAPAVSAPVEPPAAPSCRAVGRTPPCRRAGRQLPRSASLSSPTPAVESRPDARARR